MLRCRRVGWRLEGEGHGWQAEPLPDREVRRDEADRAAGDATELARRRAKWAAGGFRWRKASD